MVKPFEEAAFKGKVGELVGPVQTQFGVHIIKVIAKDNRVIKGVELTRKIVASPSTIEKQRNKANEFQYGATEIGFEKQADSSKITLRESGQFQKNGFIPFLGVNRTISGFAFRAKLNEISPVLETKDGFVVMKLTDMNDEGYRKLDDNLKKDIKSKLVRQKKLDDLRKLANDAISKAEGKIESVAKADSQLVVRSTGVLGYNTPNVPGLGSDKNFVAALSGLEKDKLSQPIETNRGIAVAVLTEKNVGSDADFEVQKDNLRKQILQEKKTQVQQNWLQALKKQAKIEDDRNAGF
jgi:parvulin-like peptidyl-prolyl isomerase